jgi:hypothetical protein
MTAAHPSWIDCSSVRHCLVDDRRGREGGLGDQRRLTDAETQRGQ